MEKEKNRREERPSEPPEARDRPRSMHEDVETWCDCCSCEAEPRWRDLDEADLEGPEEG